MTKTILIVEDNAVNMKMFNAVLQLEGYETLQATDGIGVVELVREHRPDLIVMDIRLNDRSGLDLTRQLKADQDLKTIPIVTVTAFAMKGDEEIIMAGGSDAYLSKPIEISTFLQTVARFVPIETAPRPSSAVA